MILLDKGYDLTIRELVEKALSDLTETKDVQETRDAILKFFEGRIETVLLDQGYSQDLVASMLALSLIVRLKEVRYRLDALNEFRKKWPAPMIAISSTTSAWDRFPPKARPNR